MEWPLVTVFTLIYNTNPRYVIEAIESVRANEYPNLQHIIIDDCSPNPEPKQVVKKWIDENNYPCEFYEHEVNYGICKTLNHVLELTKGKYIFGCSDDMILPNRIKDDVISLEGEDNSIAFISSISQFIDENSSILPNFFPIYNFDLSKVDIWPILLVSSPFSAPASTIRVDVLKKLGGYSEDYIFEDYSFWFKLISSNYKFKFSPKIQTLYRISSSSISFTKKREIIIDCLKLQLDFARNSDDLKIIKKNIIDLMLKQEDLEVTNTMMLMFLKKEFYLEFKLVTLVNKISILKRVTRYLLLKWLNLKHFLKNTK